MTCPFASRKSALVPSKQASISTFSGFTLLTFGSSRTSPAVRRPFTAICENRSINCCLATAVVTAEMSAVQSFPGSRPGPIHELLVPPVGGQGRLGVHHLLRRQVRRPRIRRGRRRDVDDA